jgi:DNA-binding XRE family transcriptional regulator
VWPLSWRFGTQLPAPSRIDSQPRAASTRPVAARGRYDTNANEVGLFLRELPTSAVQGSKLQVTVGANDTRWYVRGLNEELATLGMSYLELARELGVSHQTVYGWTRGISLPQFAQFQDLCESLDWRHPARS